MDFCQKCGQFREVHPLTCYHFICLGCSAERCPLCSQPFQLLEPLSIRRMAVFGLDSSSEPQLGNPILDRLVDRYQVLVNENRERYQQYLRDRDNYTQTNFRLVNLAEQGRYFPPLTLQPEYHPKDIVLVEGELVANDYRMIQSYPYSDSKLILDGSQLVGYSDLPELTSEQVRCLFELECPFTLDTKTWKLGPYDVRGTLLQDRKSQFRWYPGYLAFFNHEYLDFYETGSTLIHQKRLSMCQWTRDDVLILPGYVVVKVRDSSTLRFMSIDDSSDILLGMNDHIHQAICYGQRIYLLGQLRVYVLERT